MKKLLILLTVFLNLNYAKDFDFNYFYIVKDKCNLYYNQFVEYKKVQNILKLLMKQKRYIYVINYLGLLEPVLKPQPFVFKKIILKQQKQNENFIRERKFFIKEYCNGYFLDKKPYIKKNKEYVFNTMYSNFSSFLLEKKYFKTKISKPVCDLYLFLNSSSFYRKENKKFLSVIQNFCFYLKKEDAAFSDYNFLLTRY